MLRPLYSWGKRPLHPLNGRLCFPLNLSACYGEEKRFHHCPCRELNPGRPARGDLYEMKPRYRLHFTTASRPALGPTQPPNQWVPWALSLGVKRPGHEADHSPLYSTGMKECREIYLHAPWRGA